MIPIDMGQLMSKYDQTILILNPTDGIVSDALSSQLISHKKLKLIFAEFRKIYNENRKLSINVLEDVLKLILYDMLLNNNDMTKCQTLSPELKASIVKYWCEVHLRNHLRNNQASQEWV